MTGSEGPDAALPSRCFPGLSLFAEQGLPARQRRESYAYRGKNYADDTCPARNPRPSQSGCSWRRQAKGRASRMSVLLTQRHCWRHGRQGSISGSIELHGLMGRRNCSEFRERNRLWRLDGPPAIANWISAVFSKWQSTSIQSIGTAVAHDRRYLEHLAGASLGIPRGSTRHLLELAAMACQATESSRRNWALAIDRRRRSLGHDVAHMAVSAPLAST